MPPDELKVAIIVATTGKWALICWIFIYLFIVENKVWQFQI